MVKNVSMVTLSLFLVLIIGCEGGAGKEGNPEKIVNDYLRDLCGLTETDNRRSHLTGSMLANLEDNLLTPEHSEILEKFYVARSRSNYDAGEFVESLEFEETWRTASTRKIKVKVTHRRGGTEDLVVYTLILKDDGWKIADEQVL